MTINRYSFGKIVIDNNEYEHDVAILKNEIRKWQRKEGHRTDIEDIEEFVKEKPTLIIIGTGYAGIMKVSEQTRQFIKERGIKLIIERTGMAVRIFNEEKEENKIALLHLTC